MYSFNNIYIMLLTLKNFIITNHISDVKHLNISIFCLKKVDWYIFLFTLAENQRFYALL